MKSLEERQKEIPTIMMDVYHLVNSPSDKEG
jgi:hypothetical protein